MGHEMHGCVWATCGRVRASARFSRRRRIAVKGDWNGGTPGERAFLRVVRDSACKRFGTVLSPEYDAAHADHLHLEVGDNSFCR